jgi:hypothetical protein
MEVGLSDCDLANNGEDIWRMPGQSDISIIAGGVVRMDSDEG